MSDPEAIGEAVSGTALARAVEPAAGEIGADGHTHERACLNCGTPLVGNFCGECGQRAHVHRTLTAFAHDLVHGVLHLDGKVWRTLPMLVRRPGELTRRYIEGERAKFVSPLALFLFSVFLMFAVLSQSVNLGDLRVKSNVAEAQVEERANLQSLEQKRARAVAAGQSTRSLDAEITSARENIKALQEIGRATPETVENIRLSRQLEWLRAPLVRSIQNPELLFYKVRTSAYKWSWVLIPLSAPLLWLLFPFSRRFRLYDHVVFVTYSIAFMTLLVVAVWALNWLGLGTLGLFALAIVPIHFYLQLRDAYSLSATGAALRTVALILLATAALAMFGILMLVLGVL